MTPKNNLIIRPMEHSEIPAVEELERLCFSSPWSYAMILGEFENEFSQLFVAEVDGEIAGYCGIQLLVGEGYITNVAVNPEFRRRGIGRGLVNHLVEYVTENRGEFLTLEVRRSNLAAIELYTRAGFEPVGVRRGYYSNPTEDALLMTRKFEY